MITAVLPQRGMPGHRAPVGGGAAVADRPGARTDTASTHTGGTMSPRTVGVLITDSVELMGTKITGEVEPGHDPKYERQTVRLVREGEHMTNDNDLEFRSSLAWPGPMAAFVVYDGDGKVTHRHEIKENLMIPPDYVFALRKGNGVFMRAKRPSET
jgi:hypothetical protein